MVFTFRRLPTRALAFTSAAALAGSSFLLAAPARAATSPATPVAAAVPVGLFGTADPTYDGVFRQSLSLLSFVAAGQTPPSPAVTWLLDQQCADGGFEPFRADITVPCQVSDPLTYTGEDTNSSGLAAAALIALGEKPASDRALAWVLAAQNTDGGFPYYLGGSSDSNSTAISLLATNAAAVSPSDVMKGSVSAAQFLASLQVGCDGVAANEDGGFAYQDYGSGLLASDSASVQATFALSGKSLIFVGGPVASTVPRAECPAPVPPAVLPTPAELGAGHLARLLDAYSGVVPQFDLNTGTRLTGTTAPGDTAWAILSLAAVGVGQVQLDAALAALADATAALTPSVVPSDGPTAIPSTGTASARPAPAPTARTFGDEPGLLALTALADHATGSDAAVVTALVDRILATITTVPEPVTSDTTGEPDSGSTDPEVLYKSDDALASTGISHLTPILAISGSVLVLMGWGILATTRRRGARA